MESHSESDFERGVIRTTYTMTLTELAACNQDMTIGELREAQNRMNAVRDMMEREIFYGKPKPCPYAGDPSFGSM